MAERISWSNFPVLRDFDHFDYDNHIDPANPNLLTLTLETGPNITWWKSIKLSNRSTGNRIVERETQDGTHGPLSFTVDATQIDSAKLVLCKAKFLGVHTEMYEVYELREMLGRNISLTWRTDAADNVWAALGSFFSEVATAVVHGVMTVVNAVITAVTSVVSVVTNAVAWVIGLVLAIPVVGRIIALIGNIVSFALGWVANVVVEAAFAVAGIFGVRQPEKLLRLQIVVQRDTTGPVATMDQIRPQLDFLVKIFKERANIKVIPGGPFVFTSQFDSKPIPVEQFVIIEDRPSLPQTLDVRCGPDGLQDDLGTTGSAFQIKMNNLFWGNTGRVLGYAAPLVVFAVRSFVSSSTVGCSIGPLTSY